jgi:hypothetical protein
MPGPGPMPPGPEDAILTVTFDANIIYPMALCDYLLWAAQRSVFRPGWSRSILDEAERNLVAKGVPNAPRRMQRMREAFEDADPGKAAIGRQMKKVPEGVDGDDRHVVAAALAHGATIIVTNNERHFPRAALADVGLHRMNGEQFLEFLWKNRRQDMEQALADAAAMTRHPSRTLAERLAQIGRSCPEFAAQAAEDLGLSIEVVPPEAD